MQKNVVKIRTRFAPSPTGYMHVGGLRTALYAYLLAKKGGGTFILRIEDTDRSRFIEGATEVIIKTLRDAGLFYDEGPDIGGPYEPYVQSERKHLYRPLAEELCERGAAYYEDGAIRFKAPTEGETTVVDEVFGEITTPNKDLDDMVLLKSDGMPTYNFANVVDDHLMEITHVLRGSEYITSAPKYNLLYQAFGWEIPVYITVPPIMRDYAHKLSKRDGDPTYDDLISQGYLPEALLNYIALLGWSPGGEREIFNLDELVSIFDVSGISKAPAIFDIAKLAHFSGEYIRRMTAEEFAVIAKPYVRSVVSCESIDAGAVAGLLQTRCEKLTDIPDKIDFFEALPDYETELFVNAKSKTDKAVALEMLRAVRADFETLSVWTKDAVHDIMLALVERLGVKKATLMWPVRIAASGSAVTPGGAVEICWILGREESLKRIDFAISKLKEFSVS